MIPLFTDSKTNALYISQNMIQYKYMRRIVNAALLSVFLACLPVALAGAQETGVIENPCDAENVVDTNENNLNDNCGVNVLNNDQQTNPVENDGNVPKGEVSRETVAGTNEVFADETENGAVLGASTTSNEPQVLAEQDDAQPNTPPATQATLAKTGSFAPLSVIVASLIIIPAAATFRK